MKNIILIGDSIRIGYQPFVTQELEGEAHVWGPEANGGTSRNVLAHLEEWVLERPADIVHLNCGLHDLARGPYQEEGDFDYTRVQLDEYEKNVREILSRIQNSGRKIAWATTTPVDEIAHSAKGFERRESDVEIYNAVASRVAEELNVPINDLHRIVMERGRDTMLLPDGVHYPPEGSAELGRTVAAFLRAHW